MDTRDDQVNQRQRILTILPIVRFIIAFILLGMAIYFRDVVFVLLAVAFLILGAATTWLRLRNERRMD